MVDPLKYFSLEPTFHDWCNKDLDMCYPVCGMVHIKISLAAIRRRWVSFSHYINGPLPYVRYHVTVTKCVECVVK